MVAGDDDDLGGRAEHLTERLQDGAGELERVPRRALAQLDDIAEEHDPVGVGGRVEQRRTLGGADGERPGLTAHPDAGPRRPACARR